ncbi:MAG: hypothetical protein GWN30_39025 [Gammaproteobacteria bacterium]|nr:hypothetical protein [Gammaproteobacteria bacterium]
MKRKITLVLITFMLVVLLSACMEARPEINMEGFNEPGHISYTYLRFTGIQYGEIDAEEGDTIVLHYTAGMIRGRLLMQINAPSQDLLWDVILDENIDKTVEIPVNENGIHTLIIRGINARGSFDVQWEVRD